MGACNCSACCFAIFSNLSCNICGCYLMLQSFGQLRATMLRPCMRTGSIFNTQHVATRRTGWPNVCNVLCPRMLRYVAFKCCDCLAGACKYCANNAICCVEKLRSFGRSFRWVTRFFLRYGAPQSPSQTLLGSSRKGGEALRDDANNCCEGDQGLPYKR